MVISLTEGKKLRNTYRLCKKVISSLNLPVCALFNVISIIATFFLVFAQLSLQNCFYCCQSISIPLFNVELVLKTDGLTFSAGFYLSISGQQVAKALKQQSVPTLPPRLTAYCYCGTLLGFPLSTLQST